MAASTPAWVVGLISVVTLALLSLVSMYDRGQRSLVSQRGLAASSLSPQSAQLMDALSDRSFSAWLSDAIARLRHDDRVAEALRSNASVMAPRLEPIAPLENPGRAVDLPAAGSSQGTLEARPPGGVDVTTFDRHLSRDLVARFASPDGMIIVSFVNAHYLDFARNWIRHLRQVGNEHFVIGALDDEAFSSLREMNAPSFDMAASLTTRDFGWGSKVFKKAQQKKIAMFLEVLEFGYQVLLSDIDVMYLRDPFGFFRSVPGADVLISSDLLHPTVSDGGPETHHGFGAVLNVGILFMRPSQGTKQLTRRWNDMCAKNLDFWEQAAFNSLVRDTGGRSGPVDKSAGPYHERMRLMYKGQVKLAVLPVSMFCSGHTAFVQNLPRATGKAAYAVHATFQYAGTNGKRHRMREWMVWQDAPEYYNPAAGLIAMDWRVPDHLLQPFREEKGTVPLHFDLVNWQLARIRSALVVAELTGRILIMPKLYCGFDRWWAPHAGRIPGSHMPLPIECPLDHVFNLEGGFRPENIREYSFLDNPLLPSAVLAKQHNLSIPPKTSPEELGAMLVAPEAKRASVLRLVDVPPDVFQSGLSEEKRKAFMARGRQFLGIWCCIRPPKGKPGHIWCVGPFARREGRTKLRSGPHSLAGTGMTSSGTSCPTRTALASSGRPSGCPCPPNEPWL